MDGPVVRPRRTAARAGIVGLAMLMVVSGAGPALAGHCPAGAPGGLTAVHVAEGVMLGLHEARDIIPEDATTAGPYIAAAIAAAASTAVWAGLRIAEEVKEDCEQGHHYETVDQIATDTTKILEQQDDALAIEIEAALRHGTTPSGLFTLPASEGGFLDSTPVGVQAFVTGLYDSYDAAGILMGTFADDYIATADDHLAAGRWKLAYRMYRLAYLQIVRTL